MAALSDKALSILAFACYHQLESGERVASVIRRDGAGHQADPDGVAELESRGLVTTDEAKIYLSEEAQGMVDRMIEVMRCKGPQD